MSHLSHSSGEALPLPLPCPLLSVTLLRRQRFPLLGDDVGMKSGAPATQKARFGQNRVRGGASVKRKRSHRTPVYWKRRGVHGGMGRLSCIRKRSVCLYVWHLRIPLLPVRPGPVSKHSRCLLEAIRRMSVC